MHWVLEVFNDFYRDYHIELFWEVFRKFVIQIYLQKIYMIMRTKIL